MGILYFYLFAWVFTALIISALERGRKKYGLGGGSSYILRELDISILKILIFGFTCFGNFLFGSMMKPAAFVLMQVMIFAGALLFALFMEARCIAQARRYREEMLEEITALNKETEKDPLNGAWLERLAELHKKTGDIGAATACAEKACALDPNCPNRWKLEALKEIPQPQLDISPARALIGGYFMFLAGLFKNAGRFLLAKVRGSQ